ncbi:sugar O-acyltransferase, sialic acid O-acetyltransferase NeuD family [Dyadobacter soli]|uniref:Sugar O-acyltransferase, sialic acid O-acetyltransferase NeuD family n=1 Tax=Dyadobacter soli TaxID=659014 RepID=A0A1G7EU51_9BACT|nr:acetyltransferase [Dyadobacter soli]SDE67107.1 sugar O-acyltransferase, sialic acid O-acetyltransferase NeuD family [Dyadobacter soli]
MLIFGAGGHAKVVRSILAARGEHVGGVFDDNWQEKAQGNPMLRGYDPMFKPLEKLIIAIGNNYDRRKVAKSITHSFGRGIHPTAIVDRSVNGGEGIVIVHNAVVQAECRIGDHVIINTAAIVDHECIIDSFAHVGPGATLCGGVHVGECALVGAGSVVLPGVKIGRECVIGAGSVVTCDVPDFAIVAGNPARIIH